MQNKFDELNQLLKTFAAQKAEHRAAVAKIQECENFTPQYKRTLLEPLEEQYIPIVSETEEKVERLVQEINSGIHEMSDNVDFLGNAEFSNALKMIELSKGSLPIDVLDKINAKFSGNKNALLTLKSVYRAQNVYEGDIDAMIASGDRETQAIQDAAYFSIAQGKPLQPLATAIATYAGENGYTFNTDFITYDEV